MFSIHSLNVRILLTLNPNNTSSLLTFKADPNVLLACLQMELAKNGVSLDWLQNHYDETTHKFLANIFSAFQLFYQSFVQ